MKTGGRPEVMAMQILQQRQPSRGQQTLFYLVSFVPENLYSAVHDKQQNKPPPLEEGESGQGSQLFPF